MMSYKTSHPLKSDDINNFFGFFCHQINFILYYKNTKICVDCFILMDTYYTSKYMACYSNPLGLFQNKKATLNIYEFPL